jgi:hypothetical protein
MDRALREALPWGRLRQSRSRAIGSQSHLKEFVMSKTFQSGAESDLDLVVVDLGDAKELTLGTPSQERSEDNQQFPHKIMT